MTIATPADVEARWPPGVPVPPAEVIQTWLNDAETILRARYPNLDDLVDEGEETVRAGVVLVLCRMVIRALSNPRGVVREQVGDTSVSYRTDALGLLEVSDADQDLLDDLFGLPTGNLVSIPLTVGGVTEWPDDWWQRNLDDPWP